MPENPHTDRSARSRRARMRAGAALASGVPVAGCGASLPARPQRRAAARAPGRRPPQPARRPPLDRAPQPAAVPKARARPRRVPTGRGRSRSPGACAPTACPATQTRPPAEVPAAYRSATTPAAPAFNSAATKCGHLVPGSGPPTGPGQSTHPTAQTLTMLLRIATCMRRHGVPQFPDPRTTMPCRPPAGIQEITDYDNAILLFPTTINMQAPAYKQALAACGAPPLGLPH